MAIDTNSLRKFRRWVRQYEMTQGAPPPQHMMSSFLEGQIEANIAREQADRALSLQERQLDIGEEQFEQKLGETQRQFDVSSQQWERGQRFTEKAVEKQLESQRMGGYLNIASTAANVAEAWPELGEMGGDLWSGISNIGLTSWEGIASGYEMGSNWLSSIFSVW